MGEVKTFQTIKLPLSVWQMVARHMDAEQLNFSEATERLIRYGTAYYEMKREQWDAPLKLPVGAI